MSDLSLARRLTAQACVECGVCTYVCPARLPLSQRVKQLKRVLCGLDRDLPLFAGRH
jgi:electron transport complex protein RnfC